MASWVARSVALCALVLATDRAAAFPVGLTVDPIASTVTVGEGSAITVNMGGAVVIPLEPQTAGTGATLPNGVVSDGLTTFLDGTIAVDLSADTIATARTGTLLDAGVSGAWIPGVAGSLTPADADVGTSFADPVLSGDAVLRGLSFQIGDGGAALSEGGVPGMLEFPAGVTFDLASGLVGYDTDVTGLDGASLLVNKPYENAATIATLELLGGGDVRLTLPVDLLLRIDQTDLVSGLPVEILQIDLVLQGQIVAHGTVAGDADGDLVLAEVDNCPNVPNRTQDDTDQNGLGDACQCGDVNGDGVTNVTDALQIARGELLASDPNFGKCDVNGDGVCNVTDALKVARGEISSAPEEQLCPTWEGIEP